MDQLGGAARGRPASDVTQPSRTILMGESTDWAADWIVPEWAQAAPAGSPAGAPLIHTHDGFTNWLFCDGHVRALKVAQTLAPRDLWVAHRIGDPQERADREAMVEHILATLAPEYR